MTAETGNTALDVIIPEVWQKKILSAIYDGGKVISRVDNVSGEVSRMGDIIHLPSFPTLTVNDVTAATGVVFVNDTTITAVTPTHPTGVVDVTVPGVDVLRRGYAFGTPPEALPPIPIPPSAGSS